MPAMKPVPLILLSVVATLAFCWATWSLFLAQRTGADTPEAFVERVAGFIRTADYAAFADALDPTFAFEPGGLDRSAVLAFLRSEPRDGRMHPFVALVHEIPSPTEGRLRVAVVGVRCQGDPAEQRNAAHSSFRIECELVHDRGHFRVMWAKVHPVR